MASRRKFIKAGSAVSLTSLLPFTTPSLPAKSEHTSLIFPTSKKIDPTDEDFWREIRQEYTLPTNFIDLENAWYNVMARPVTNAQIGHIQSINTLGTRYIRKEHDHYRNDVKQKLGKMLGVPAEELALLRNATEGLNVVIMGYPFKPGEEAIVAQQDYFTILQAFLQRQKRDGLVLKKINRPFQVMTDEEIVKAYQEQITPNTRLILVTQMINTTGQILPLQQITEMAHERGVEVLTDAAQSFAQVPINLPETRSDYFSASLHKWLGAPLAMGVLHMKPDRISKIWPLIGITSIFPEDDIRKFEYVGTNAIANERTISNALEYHNNIGTENISARLRYLTSYWTNLVKDIPSVTINTPVEHQRSCAIANFSIKGWEPDALEQQLFDQYGIYTMRINYQGVNGIRVTPQVYNSTEELDALVAAIQDISANKASN